MNSCKFPITTAETANAVLPAQSQPIGDRSLLVRALVIELSC